MFVDIGHGSCMHVLYEVKSFSRPSHIHSSPEHSSTLYNSIHIVRCFDIFPGEFNYSERKIHIYIYIIKKKYIHNFVFTRIVIRST